MKLKATLTLLSFLCLLATANAQKRFLYIGDSITDGNWGTNCNGERNLWDQNHIFGHGYMFICAAQLMSEYADQKPEFFNRGISGNTVNDLAARWQTDALDLRPDVLSVLVGINDVLLAPDFNVDTLAYENTLRDLLSQSRQQNPKLVIVLGEPFCADGFRIDAEGRAKTVCYALSRAVQRVAKDFDAIFLPYQSLFDELCQRNGTEYWIWDGVHPTAAGHHKMAKMWMEKTEHLNLLQH